MPGDRQWVIGALVLGFANGYFPETDVLKVGHHGRARATNAEFLAKAHSHFAVISVGATNVYRHSRPEVLKRLEDAGVHGYRTDISCVSTFLLNGKSVTTRVYLP